MSSSTEIQSLDNIYKNVISTLSQLHRENDLPKIFKR